MKNLKRLRSFILAFVLMMGLSVPAAADAYYSRAVNWATANGIIFGYGSRRFGPNNPVTREQIATILWRYDGIPSAGRGTDFADESSITSYAE